jgi:hypothetical protein
MFFERGEKVIVDISNEDRYFFTESAFNNLNNATGIIKEKYFDNSKYLIEFDEPRKKLYSNGLPIKEFWFKPTQLRRM